MTTRIPLILLLNAAGLALFLSWYMPVNHGFWFPLDAGLFHFFNQALVKSQAFLWVVAITNNRAFDGCSLLAMGCLMLSFWLKEDQTGRRRIVIIGLVMLLAAVVINQLAQHLMPVKRASPSLYFPNINRVSELLHISTKDASKDSFPGDHGMMLLIFSAFMLRYFGKKAFAIALIIVVVFAFPRVMIGAHWLTDIAVGSLSAVLIGIPWCLMTPMSDRLIDLFDRYLPGKKQQNRNK
ncbi:phosphatase PAP2 family protein [Enterobacter huaxiensis]|uniref:Lipid A 1-diphosphate synthase n=1 Tax=Enterobacter huaxiensis TaxID=2494702 RepID=A0A428LLN0_9ENTR|nr:phosphatase PAP2 family protein [Enterobacter huaxiensis]MCS5450680.1 phosphatase PAP2 family protein [Enterobacter huaxiensis]MEB7543403.1 phosphatase PAP2 family protein [Enterobacter huaxiensis]MEB7579567.1 phosphatase PAP2 family protein [Enterobacter huaxiensis]MEB7662235.1 phosphatase PAP2 family protein [Enterobacter huaxiensis]RSK65277.1 phosphatase PAP2 family protein [Enterobacter huaxiensis]